MCIGCLASRSFARRAAYGPWHYFAAAVARPAVADGILMASQSSRVASEALCRACAITHTMLAEQPEAHPVARAVASFQRKGARPFERLRIIADYATLCRGVRHRRQALEKAAIVLWVLCRQRTTGIPYEILDLIITQWLAIELVHCTRTPFIK